MDHAENETSLDTPATTPVLQIAVFLQNRAGSLLSIMELLKQNHVVVLGMSVQDSTDAAVVRFIVSDPETVIHLFMEKGIPFTRTELIVVELNEGATQIPDCFRTILNAETNIHFVYPLLSRPNGKSALALCVEDNDFGSAVLTKSGYKILGQEDISR
ncbi:MAG: acetolactate synthase [Verrucomicrobiota bacterium]